MSDESWVILEFPSAKQISPELPSWSEAWDWLCAFHNDAFDDDPRTMEGVTFYQIERVY